MLVVVDQKTVFCVHADHGSPVHEDTRDFCQLFVEDVGDLFGKILVRLLRSEGGSRESVLDNVGHSRFGGVRESRGQGLEARDFKGFIERRAET